MKDYRLKVWKKKIHISFDRIFLAFSILVAIGSAFFIWNLHRQGKKPFIFGHRPYIIRHDSMGPYIKMNSFVIIKNKKYEKVRPGEIILFKNPDANKTPENICHQVMEITKHGFVTRGMKNMYKDRKLVNKEHYVGSLAFKSNRIGNYINFFKGSILLASLLPLAVIAGLILIFPFLKRKIKKFWKARGWRPINFKLIKLKFTKIKNWVVKKWG